eukprot:2430227-Rhodomonas_salina.1
MREERGEEREEREERGERGGREGPKRQTTPERPQATISAPRTAKLSRMPGPAHAKGLGRVALYTARGRLSKAREEGAEGGDGHCWRRSSRRRRRW